MLDAHVALERLSAAIDQLVDAVREDGRRREREYDRIRERLTDSFAEIGDVLRAQNDNTRERIQDILDTIKVLMPRGHEAMLDKIKALHDTLKDISVREFAREAAEIIRRELESKSDEPEHSNNKDNKDTDSIVFKVDKEGGVKFAFDSPGFRKAIQIGKFIAYGLMSIYAGGGIAKMIQEAFQKATGH